MTPQPHAFVPTLTVLCDDDKRRIYHAALRVLEETGMVLQHEGATERLIDAGCRLTPDGWVTIPATLVEAAIASAPATIALFDREGRQAMDVGGRRAFFGTGSDVMVHIDGKTLERRATRLDSVARAARLCDALPNIDFIMSFAIPHEIDPRRAFIESFAAMAVNSVKPIVAIADSREELTVIRDMSLAFRENPAHLREKPYWVHLSGPISPLKHPFKSIDKLVFCAQQGIPVIYCPAPIAGSTAPMTIAGHLT
jgi:trimethylamine--corrinoid protein Co-methyltransferase